MTLPGSCRLQRRMLPKLMLPMLSPGSIFGATFARFTGVSAHLPWSYLPVGPLFRVEWGRYRATTDPSPTRPARTFDALSWSGTMRARKTVEMLLSAALDPRDILRGG